MCCITPSNPSCFSLHQASWFSGIEPQLFRPLDVVVTPVVINIAFHIENTYLCIYYSL